MNRDLRWKKDDRLLIVLLVCVSVMLIFDFLIVSNLLQYHALDQQMEALHQRIGFLKQEAVWQEKEAGYEQLTESRNVPETVELTENRDVSEIVKQDEGESEKGTEKGKQENLLAEESLKRNLEEIMKNTGDIGGQWAISVMDLSDGTVCGIRDDISMQSASVIKVFIMAAVYGRICYPENEALAVYAPEQYEGELKDLLTNMITVSDNDAANRLVELLGEGDFQTGKEVVNSFCQSNGYYGTHLGRRFLEEVPRDDNFTTAADCRKILWDIYSGSCVCEEASAKMMSFLQNQTVKTKIPSGIPEGITCANKTGEMPEGYGLGCIENDIAVVYGEHKDYILCILANDLNGRNEEAKKKIREISRYIYEEFM